MAKQQLVRSEETRALAVQVTLNVRTFDMSGQYIMYGHLSKAVLLQLCDVDLKVFSGVTARTL
ncbi:hypothetical protein D3C81_2311070 [compost metagenome]